MKTRLLLFLMLTMVVSAFRQPIPNRTFQMQGTLKLADALREFSKQTAIDYCLNPDNFAGIAAKPIKLKSNDAWYILDELAKSYGFTYKKTGTNSVVIKPVNKPTSDRRTANSILTGYAFDTNGNNLSGVKVLLPQLALGTTTDTTGYYKLIIPNPSAEVKLKAVAKGYTTVVNNVTVDQYTSHSIVMSPLPISTTAQTNAKAIVHSPDSAPTVQAVNTNYIPIVGKLLKGRDTAKRSLVDSIYLRKLRVRVSLWPNLRLTNYTMAGEPNFSLNMLAGSNAGLNGFEMGTVFNHLKYNMNGMQLSGGANIVQGSVQGVQVAGILNHTALGGTGFMQSGVANTVGGNFTGVQNAGIINYMNGRLRGAQIAGSVNLTNDIVQGLQITGGVNLAAEKLTGLQVAGGINYQHKATDGLQMAGGINFSPEIKGAQIAGLINLCDSIVGTQIGGLVNRSRFKHHGMQIAGLVNKATNINGIQIAGITNLNKGTVSGGQISGIANMSTETVNGFQIAGIYNKAKRVNGLQIGLINFADTLKGFNLGLINYNRVAEHYLNTSYESNGYYSINYMNGNRYGRWIYGLGYPFLRTAMVKAPHINLGLETSLYRTDNQTVQLDLGAVYHQDLQFIGTENKFSTKAFAALNIGNGRNFAFQIIASNWYQFNTKDSERQQVMTKPESSYIFRTGTRWQSFATIGLGFRYKFNR